MLIEFGGKKPRIGSNVFIAPTATLVGDVVVGDNCSIWFNAVIRGDFGPIRIGRGCSIQDNVVIHVSVETVIGDNVTIGHGAVLEGCTIGTGTVVGMHSTVLPGVRIGREVMVAAGSVLPEDFVVPEQVLVAGVPAEIKKALSGKALAWIQNAASDYMALSKKYLEEGLEQRSGF